MLRETIHATIDTDVEREIAKLRERCVAAGLDALSANLLIAQASDILSALVNQGRRIADVGSQMEAERELSGEGYLVRLVFTQGARKGLVQRLLEKFKGG
ncbi:hypothetical protein IQ16_07608 [Bradyrhizobium huanghuaihaiense]|uniref:Uncharacterized protein n=1 Tax=Bradyrhizobium huanghuaihaiense TaxID=990078 RepID=A0A562QUH2_9BRAD|nr:hypothetical protein [Bradyrhizobium huanghuaihaiense]TWI60488.1 hypothetical protein IQ16_07608 [Bradyrhizobium huanghuaihaiense]